MGDGPGDLRQTQRRLYRIREINLINNLFPAGKSITSGQASPAPAVNCTLPLLRQASVTRSPGRSYESARAIRGRFGFHHQLAGSPVGLAETGSLYYGLAVLLQLIPTRTEQHPCRADDAVPFEYRSESDYLKRTHTSLTRLPHTRTSSTLRVA